MPSIQSIPAIEGSRLTLIRVETKITKDRRKRPYLICKCSCGNDAVVDFYNYKKGDQKSCGCLQSEVRRSKATIHGMVGTRAYRTWHSMIVRCSDPTRKGADGYAGRGIAVCGEWKTFSGFYEFLKTILPDGEADIPKNLSLDREDNDGNYEPGNVRLATRIVQGRNTRSNRIIEMGGERRCVTEWADIFGVDAKKVFARLDRGHSLKDALSSSPMKRGPKDGNNNDARVAIKDVL